MARADAPPPPPPLAISAAAARGNHPLLGKTPLAVFSALALLAIPYASPKLEKFQVARIPGTEDDVEQDPVEANALAAIPAPSSTGEITLKASENTGTITNALPTDGKEVEVDPELLAKTRGSIAIENPASMDAFYARLAKTVAKEPGAVTRVLHYGDSVITSDFISGTMRRKLQKDFGDAGHGFILIANPWEWYFHNDVDHGASSGWTSSRITGPFAGDGLYGLGGVVFKGAGANAFFATTTKGDYGRKVSKFELFYLEHPQGGDVELSVESATKIPGSKPEVVRFSTKGPAKVSRKKSVAVTTPIENGAKLSVRAFGNGEDRLYGVVLEGDGPGVTYDALGANGARVRLLKGIDADHWKEQMALRDPALLVFQYGTNESEEGSVAKDYEEVLGEVLDRARAAAPNAACLVAAPLDRAEKGGTDGLRTKKVIPKLVDAQARVAKAHGCAFWNTFQAMGGEGSMAKWVRARPALGSGDFTHPTPAGAEVIGDLLHKSVLAGYEAWQAKHPTAPKLPAALAPQEPPH